MFDLQETAHSCLQMVPSTNCKGGYRDVRNVSACWEDQIKDRSLDHRSPVVESPRQQPGQKLKVVPYCIWHCTRLSLKKHINLVPQTLCPSSVAVDFPGSYGVPHSFIIDVRPWEGRSQSGYSHFKCLQDSLLLIVVIMTIPYRLVSPVRPRTNCLAWIVRV